MLLRAEGISKKYYRPTRTASHFVAVRPLDFEVREGAVTEITGRSGSGKSTLLYLLAGLQKPTTGRVVLSDGGKDCDLYAMKDAALSRLRNERFGVIPQGQTGLYALTVLQNVLSPAALYGDSGALVPRARSLLERVGIAALADAKMSELSGGEMRRMAIARALIMRPKLLFADEPTDDLDDENTRAVLELLRATADEGTGVLLVTHEAAAARYADAVYRMDAGSLSRPE